MVFAMDDYLEKSKLRPDEYEPFMQGLLRHYETDIHKYLHKKLKKLGLDHDFLIQKIRMLRSSEVPADQKNRIKYGIAIEAVIKAISLVKAYQFLEYWVNKMNWILLEVDEIHCCPKEHLTDWFIRRHNMRSILVSSAHRQPEGASERVVVFAPLMDKPHLEKELRTTTHLITGRQFNVTGRQERADVEIENRFHLVFKYKKEFERFMAGEQGGQSNLRMKIYQEYILVDCDPLG